MCEVHTVNHNHVFKERARCSRYYVWIITLNRRNLTRGVFVIDIINLVGVMTPRSILVGDFPLLHDYSVAFNQRLQNYKFRKLSTNLAVACWPRSTLCLGIAWSWQTTLADCQCDLRGTSNLDAILEWCLNFSDCWVGPRLFGAMLRFEQLGALGLYIARITEI